MTVRPPDARSVLLRALLPGDSQNTTLSAMLKKKKKKLYAHSEKILAGHTLKP